MAAFPSFDIVASNVRGLGAIQLVQSLLPAFERVAGETIGTVWLPADGDLHGYRGTLPADRYVSLRRRLPNSLSRVVECLWPGRTYPHDRPLIVLGDLPLRHRHKQIVFTHRSHLVNGADMGSIGNAITIAISKGIFALNAECVHRLVVQTETICDGLIRTFPGIADRTTIIAQPAPEWLLSDLLTRNARHDGPEPNRLKLLFPSAMYPHKNHNLLYRYIEAPGLCTQDVEISVTIDRPEGMAADERLNFTGRLDPAGMRERYRTSDALLFPSLEESYGLPIVEAICVGLPIVCADRPYARALCGDDAIYFDPLDIASLHQAIEELRQRLASGWWADWQRQRQRFPKTWDDVARKMAELLNQP